MSKFEIDFIELAFLAEVCIPPRPIARAIFFDKLSDEHYHKMSQAERDRLFEWISKNLDMENEDCAHFHARFNPDNQYSVTTKIKNVSSTVDAYLFNDKYHVLKNKFIAKQYIEYVIHKKRI